MEEERGMNLANFHSHCSFCDGRAPAEDFVQAAIAAGFTGYGVSSHAPLPFETRWTMKRELVHAYLEEIGRLKIKYRDCIELYVGMEIDYLNGAHNPSIDYFQQLPLDYRIGSVHILYNQNGEPVDIDTDADTFKQLMKQDFAGDLKQMVSDYFDTSMRMVEAGGFDFIGHMDKISYNAGQCDPLLTGYGWYKKKIADYFVLIAEKGIMVEVNTKVYAKKGCFFPQKEHFHTLKALHIPVLVNSDAHIPALVNDGRGGALEQLKQVGIRTVRQLIKGEWKEVAI